MIPGGPNVTIPPNDVDPPPVESATGVPFMKSAMRPSAGAVDVLDALQPWLAPLLPPIPASPAIPGVPPVAAVPLLLEPHPAPNARVPMRAMMESWLFMSSPGWCGRRGSQRSQSL